MTGLNARTLAELRAVPRLSEPEHPARHAAGARSGREEKAIFVDIRYPAEFAHGHLPDAINLPLRPMPTEELNEQIAKLPKRPIIVPCYDRRGCFFAEVLGLELIAGRP